jgi:hypothetical protein
MEKVNNNKFLYERCKFYVPYSVVGVDNSNIKIPLLGQISTDSETKTNPSIQQENKLSPSDTLMSSSPIDLTNDLSISNSTVKTITKLRRHSIPGFLRKPTLAKQTNLDHLLQLIGSFGFYQKLQFFLVGVMAILPSNVSISIYLAKLAK